MEVDVFPCEEPILQLDFQNESEELGSSHSSNSANSRAKYQKYKRRAEVSAEMGKEDVFGSF